MSGVDLSVARSVDVLLALLGCGILFEMCCGDLEWSGGLGLEVWWFGSATASFGVASLRSRLVQTQNCARRFVVTRRSCWCRPTSSQPACPIPISPLSDDFFARRPGDETQSASLAFENPFSPLEPNLNAFPKSHSNGGSPLHFPFPSPSPLLCAATSPSFPSFPNPKFRISSGAINPLSILQLKYPLLNSRHSGEFTPRADRRQRR